MLFFAFLALALSPEEEKALLRDMAEIKATLKVFMTQVDKRFEEMDKRFEQVDRRFEQVDKRFEELSEDINKRFEQITTFLWILAAIFTTLTATVIGFAYWDRRTII